MDRRDLRRIAFVTRRFGALQGLRTVSYGAALIFGVVSYAVLPDDFRNPINILVTAQLPIAMASAALLDAGLHGSGLPSFLALGLALSHARVAMRDWPVRRHYVVGAVVALIAAGLHMAIDRGITTFEWAILSLALVSAAMLVEGLLDRRLESGHTRPSSEAEHAHGL